jgi:hypothetical protein
MSNDFSKERFDNITTMIRYHNDKIIEAFNRFVAFSIGIVGGSFWLISQKNIESTIKEAVISSVPLLFWFLGVSTIALIYSNWSSWFGFREAESALVSDAPAPSLLKSSKEQLIMVCIILFVCVFFTCFSPLNI